MPKLYRLTYGIPLFCGSTRENYIEEAPVYWDKRTKAIYADSDKDAVKQAQSILAEALIHHKGFDFHAHLISLIEEPDVPSARSLA